MDPRQYQPAEFTRTAVNFQKRAVAESAAQLFQFEVLMRGADLVISAGIIDGASIAELVESAPADGDWYAEGIVKINTTTGAVTDRYVQWVNTQTAPASGTAVSLLAYVTVDGGIISSLGQANYGPLRSFIFGSFTTPFEVWIV